MKNVTYGSLSVGDSFVYKDKTFTKTSKVKISCCKFVNATETNNPKNKIGLREGEQVQVEE